MYQVNIIKGDNKWNVLIIVDNEIVWKGKFNTEDYAIKTASYILLDYLKGE